MQGHTLFVIFVVFHCKLHVITSTAFTHGPSIRSTQPAPKTRARPADARHLSPYKLANRPPLIHLHGQRRSGTATQKGEGLAIDR